MNVAKESSNDAFYGADAADQLDLLQALNLAMDQ
jgi:hypothetical protein